MRVYIAAPWKHRVTAASIAQLLRTTGFIISSRWHDQFPDNSAETIDPAVALREALCDWADIEAADAMLVLNIEKSEGKAVEQGMALVMGLPIVVIGGEKFHVFQYLATYRFVESLEAAIATLRDIAAPERLVPQTQTLAAATQSDR